MSWTITRFLFIALLVSPMTGTAAATGKRVALVIGNAAYTHITALKKPTNDAGKVAEVLKGLGYEVIFGANASKVELESLTQQFRAAVKDADVGFFYYSGHGFQTNRADQQHPINHIVPVDFQVQEGDQTAATLALDVVVETLKSEARVGFIFMDACRNGPQLAPERIADSKAVTISRGFSPVNIVSGGPAAAKLISGKTPTGLLIAYATDPGNVALEGDTGLLSPFTSALVKHIGAPGLSIAEVMGQVSADVSLETQGQQTPWFVSSLTAGTYRFLPDLAAAGAASRPKPAQSRPALTNAPRLPAAGATTASRPRPAQSKPALARAPRAQREAARAKKSSGAPRVTSVRASRVTSLPPNLGAGVGAGL